MINVEFLVKTPPSPLHHHGIILLAIPPAPTDMNIHDNWNGEFRALGLHDLLNVAGSLFDRFFRDLKKDGIMDRQQHLAAGR